MDKIIIYFDASTEPPWKYFPLEDNEFIGDDDYVRQHACVLFIGKKFVVCAKLNVLKIKLVA